MSILIKGMEMPKNCGECPMICEDDLCRITKGGRTIKDRPPHCPLIEVPPHGRLIDADAFMPKIDGAKKLGINTIAYYLNDAPTIIEEQEGE